MGRDFYIGPLLAGLATYCLLFAYVALDPRVRAMAQVQVPAPSYEDALDHMPWFGAADMKDLKSSLWNTAYDIPLIDFADLWKNEAATKAVIKVAWTEGAAPADSVVNAKYGALTNWMDFMSRWQAARLDNKLDTYAAAQKMYDEMWKLWESAKAAYWNNKDGPIRIPNPALELWKDKQTADTDVSTKPPSHLELDIKAGPWLFFGPTAWKKTAIHHAQRKIRMTMETLRRQQQSSNSISNNNNRQQVHTTNNAIGQNEQQSGGIINTQQSGGILNTHQSGGVGHDQRHVSFVGGSNSNNGAILSSHHQTTANPVQPQTSQTELLSEVAALRQQVQHFQSQQHLATNPNLLTHHHHSSQFPSHPHIQDGNKRRRLEPNILRGHHYPPPYPTPYPDYPAPPPQYHAHRVPPNHSRPIADHLYPNQYYPPSQFAPNPTYPPSQFATNPRHPLYPTSTPTQQYPPNPTTVPPQQHLLHSTTTSTTNNLPNTTTTSTSNIPPNTTTTLTTNNLRSSTIIAQPAIPNSSRATTTSLQNRQSSTTSSNTQLPDNPNSGTAALSLPSLSGNTLAGALNDAAQASLTPSSAQQQQVQSPVALSPP